jgi:DNA-binding transcriptional LysR family regulator
MELRHFRYVIAVADTLHFGHAAARLHISQPPLSQQIRQLEEELGVTLFHRTKRQVQLTEAGKMFVQDARLILAQAEHVAKLAMRLSDGEVGQLTIGVAGAADAPIFIDILRLFDKRHPHIRVRVRNMSTAQQALALQEGRLHVGFLVPPLDDSGLTLETVTQQPIVIALPTKHPLAARTHVPLKALADESHIMFARDVAPRFFDAIVGACREAGFGLNVVHEVDNLYTACALVAAGLGVCFVPAGIQERRSKSLVLRPVRPELPGIDSQIALAYRQEPLCHIVQLFVAVVREVACKRGGKSKKTTENKVMTDLPSSGNVFRARPKSHARR